MHHIDDTLRRASARGRWLSKLLKAGGLIAGPMAAAIWFGGVVAAPLGAVEPASGLTSFTFSSRVEVSRVGGDATYKIGGRLEQNGISERLPFPISRLEWPMESEGLHLSVSVHHASRWEGRLMGEIGGGREGVMRDADWELPESPRRITTYSESEAQAEWRGVEASVRRWTADHGARKGFWKAAIGVGLRYRHTEWQARDAVQWYPLFPCEGVDVFAGRVVDYETTVWVPFGEVNLAWENGPWSASVRSGLAPWVRVEDRDDHRLRGIEARARMNGDGGFVDLSLEHRLGQRWRVGIHWRNEWLRADGWSRNVVYRAADPDLIPGERWRIREEFTLSQWQAGLSVSRRW